MLYSYLKIFDIKKSEDYFHHTDKKVKNIFLIYKESHKGAVAK
jgi:hypothetical protein